MKRIKQTYLINAPIEEVWRALVDVHSIERWGGGPAKMTDAVGFEFSLWGGTIWGKNIEVLANQKLVQEWFSDEENKWDKPSIVTFTLFKLRGGGTKLDLTQKDIPDENAQDIENGWKDYYLGPLKEYLETN